MKWFIITCSCLLSSALISAAPVEGTVEKTTENASVTTIDLNYLKKDLLEIMEMIPTNKIKDIALRHLREDDGFKQAVKFMMSPEWINLVEVIQSTPEWLAFKEHFSSFGIPIDSIITCFETFVSNVTIENPENEDAKRNLTGFIDEVEDSIPVTDILVKFNEKMQENPNIHMLLEKLAEPKSKAIFEDVLRIAEVRTMLDELKEMGLNLYDFFSLLYIFLGWGELKL